MWGGGFIDLQGWQGIFFILVQRLHCTMKSSRAQETLRSVRKIKFCRSRVDLPSEGGGSLRAQRDSGSSNSLVKRILSRPGRIFCVILISLMAPNLVSRTVRIYRCGEGTGQKTQTRRYLCRQEKLSSYLKVPLENFRLNPWTGMHWYALSGVRKAVGSEGEGIREWQRLCRQDFSSILRASLEAPSLSF